MDLGSLLLALALILLVVAFVARPLLERAARRESAMPGAEQAADDLAAQRETTLIELRDLDFDHTTGKVSDDDYAAQRARLVAKGAQILRALDQLPVADSSATDLDAEIERLVAARRQTSGVKTVEKTLPVKTHLQPVSGNQCPHCQQAIHPGDKFCARCGAKISSTPETA